MKPLAVTLGFFLILAGFHSVYSETTQIPSWIKNTARLWSEQKIDDTQFVQSIQYMIKQEIIRIPIQESTKHVYTLPKYGQLSFVTISGTTGDFKKTNNALLTILRPDGKTIELTAAVLETGVYHTTLIIDHNFPAGIYKVTGTYNDVAIPIWYFDITQNVLTKIPFWIKNNARWWYDEKISDNDFVSGIQYLINKKIIQIEYNLETPKQQNLHIDVQGYSQVRRGTMQMIAVTVTDEQDPISGATIIVQVEDYGDNILKDFKGQTDLYGKYLFSWEIDKNADAETLLVFVDVTDGFSSASSVFSFEVICHCGEPDCKCR